MDEFLRNVLQRAIAELKEEKTLVYTFAFYHDHESGAVSVCADTLENSREAVENANSFNMKYFSEFLEEGDYEELELWQANIGRNLSLGDFAYVNIARYELPEGCEINEGFYLAMVRAVISVQEEVLGIAASREELIFCCSGADSEVALVWTEIKGV